MDSRTAQPAAAIVGIAAALPSGRYQPTNLDYHSFFLFLLNQGESYEKIPADRLNIDALRGRALGQVLPTHGSFLKDLDQFDHLELGVTAKDARALAVSTRKLLELSFLSLLDSGIDYRGRNVGCYMSGIAHDIHMVSGQDESEARGSFGGLPAMIANRVSYHLDLRGPSIPVDTACSSSLTGMHLAVQSIVSGECEAALVGGAQINVRFAEWLNYTQGGVLSKDGKCKPFNAEADGFSRGEGAVVMVLKPLEQAMADGDHVYATILGTGINSAGSLAPVNAPVAAAQEDAMDRAFAQAHRSPQEVDFVELHATGTARGDPTEANWVGKRFSRNDELLVGSVKGNIGHLEITAFLASLTKVCGIFESGLIPPNVNLGTPNPAIRFGEYKMRIPTHLERLPARSPTGRSLVAMTSSGIGGANGHVVVESPPPPAAYPAQRSFWRETYVPEVELTLVGGLSPRSTAAVAEAAKVALKDAGARAVALSYARRTRSMTWRSFAVTSKGKEARFSEPVLAAKGKQPLVFVFSGQGPQHIEMGRELFQASRVFHDSVLEMDAVYERVTGESLINTYGLFAQKRANAKPLGDIWPIAITLPSLTVVQLALFDTLVSLGINPDAVVGHSAGETAVLYASGAASRTAAVELSIARGRGMSCLEEQDGTMAAVNCPPAQAEAIIAAVKAELGAGSLEIGCYNTHDAITLSGSTPFVELAVEKASAMGIFARRLRTRVPVHSSMVELAREEYQACVGDVFQTHDIAAPSIPVYSAMSGGVLNRDIQMGAEYFWTNTRGPVRFTEAVASLVAEHGAATFIELSPHPVLASYLSTLGGKASTVVAPMRRANPKKGETNVEVHALLSALGQLAVAGHNSADVAQLAGAHVRPARVLPPYPFAPKTVPYAVPSAEIARAVQARNGPLNYPQLRVSNATHPSLAQHVIKGESIMPAAGYLEMALEFGARKVWGAQFISIIALSAPRPVPVQVSLDKNQWTIKSSAATDLAAWPPKFDRLHAQGFLTTEVTPQDRIPAALDLAAIRARCTPVNMRTFYEDMRYFAEYGPEYRRITSISRGRTEGRDEALVGLRGLTDDLAGSPKYILHPAILDAAIHAVVHPELTQCRDKGLYYLPSKVKSLIVHDALLDRGMLQELYTHVIARSWRPDALVWDCFLVDSNGARLCSIEGLEVARHGDALSGQITRRFDVKYEPTEISIAEYRPSRAPSFVDSGLGSEGGVSATAKVASSSSFTHIIYRRGREMQIRDQLAQHDPLAERTVWFSSQSGLDGAAATGFTRSVRREYPAWMVKAAVLDKSWPLADHARVIAELADMAVEDEMAVDASGTVVVPRLTPMEAPRLRTPFNAEKPWVFENGRVQQMSLPSLKGDHVLVAVSGLSNDAGSIKGFTGCIRGKEQLVMGITFEPLSNFVSAHPEALVEISSPPTHTPPILAMAVSVLALGPGVFTKPERMRNSTVVVTHADSSVGKGLLAIFSALNLNVVAIPSCASSFELGMREETGAKLIISGYVDGAENVILARALSPNGKLFAWKAALPALLREEPWTVGDAIRMAVDCAALSHLSEAMAEPLTVVAAPKVGDAVAHTGTLFDSSKAYILIGGIGSLGFQIALWMYEHGARHIIMTSRSGPASILERGDAFSQRTLAYLQSLDDLELNLEAVDAMSLDAMNSLISIISKDIGGCMLLTAVLRDRMLSQQTAKTYSEAYDAKVKAFEVVEKALRVPSLDWLVAFTSVSGFFGSAGQTNYAAGNTVMEALVSKYDNAFSLVAPIITDSTIASPENASTLKHLMHWGFTARELCVCIEDGIRKLSDGPFGLYVPDFDWSTVADWLGRSPVFAHLLQDNASVVSGEDDASLDKLVVKLLDVPAEDFSPDVPLTSYGLDSLSAARLSVALKPFVTITQMQLLGDVSLNHVKARMSVDEANAPHAAAESAPAEPSKPAPLALTLRPRAVGFDWKTLHQPGETIVKVLEVEDPTAVPLILMCGTSGNGMAFYPFESTYPGPLWFLQMTPETPMDSMDSLTEFYYTTIKTARPHGPYRFGVFCATTPIMLEVARKFEARGDSVAQLAFLDHFPSAFCLRPNALDAETLRSGAMSARYLEESVQLLLRSYEEGGSGLIPYRARMRDDLRAAFEGRTAPRGSEVYRDNFIAILRLLVKYVLECVPSADRADPAAFTAAFREELARRMSGVRAPMKVYCAADGVVCATDPERRWEDFGVTPADVVDVAGGHFDMFQEEKLARRLFEDWRQ